MPNHSKDRVLLRRTLTHQRRQLSHANLNRAGRSLAVQARSYLPLFAAKRVASYAPMQGEISPLILTNRLVNSALYLPRIVNYPARRILFYQVSELTSQNRFSIREPKPVGRPLTANQFDAMLVPLVAFDRRGNRLGMGGGFYDTALSFRLDHPTQRRPVLIGLAHHFQEVKSLTQQSWDVPLDVIITDRDVIRIRI